MVHHLQNPEPLSQLFSQPPEPPAIGWFRFFPGFSTILHLEGKLIKLRKIPGSKLLQHHYRKPQITSQISQPPSGLKKSATPSNFFPPQNIICTTYTLKKKTGPGTIHPPTKKKMSPGSILFLGMGSHLSLRPKRPKAKSASILTVKTFRRSEREEPGRGMVTRVGSIGFFGGRKPFPANTRWGKRWG